MITTLYASGWAKAAWLRAVSGQERPGQALFNILPMEVAKVIAGRMFDPFHKTYETEGQLIMWINDHLMFNDEGLIIAVFDGDNILLEV